jgi:hypothetical protein
MADSAFVARLRDTPSCAMTRPASLTEALAVLDSAMPTVLTGLLNDPPFLPSTVLELDERVRLDAVPLSESWTPTRLENSSIVRPFEMRMPMREAVKLLRLPPSERGFHAYVRHMPLDKAPRAMAMLQTAKLLHLYAITRSPLLSHPLAPPTSLVRPTLVLPIM